MSGFDILGIGFPELVAILLIAGIVMGPQRIAQFARQMGKWTAQLQGISRGFMRQLQSELDSSEMEDLKDAMAEIKDLRKQLIDLRGEITAVSTTAAKDLRDTAEELESILPPQINENKAVTNGAAPETNKNKPISNNGDTSILPPLDQLPNILDVEDDPDS